MDLKEIWAKMSWSNKMNLFFVILIVPCLLFWSFTLIQTMKEVNRINEGQFEECYMLECEVTMFGGMVCEGTKMRGGYPFRMENSSLNITNVQRTMK